MGKAYISTKIKKKGVLCLKGKIQGQRKNRKIGCRVSEDEDGMGG